MTLSPDDLAAMGERHRETTVNYDPLGEAPDEQVCVHDEESWPCDSRRLLDEVEATTCTGCGHPWRGSDHVHGKRSCCPDCSHFDSEEEA